jgi:hypothetical protein
MYGITLSNLSYENINMSQLYIKYDKNLILKLKNLKIKDKNVTYLFDIDVHLDMYNDKYYIQIDKLNFKNSKLILKSDIALTQKQINNISKLKIKNLEVKNFSLKFDKNIAPIETKSTYITYKNDNLYFSFKNPQLDNIKLDKSNVVLKHLSKSMILYLDLYSKGKIGNKLKNIINYYGVDLSIKQYYGFNEINVKVSVPFNNDKVDLFVDVKSENTKILYDKKLIIAEKLYVKYSNNILDIKSNNGQIYIFDRNITYNKFDLIYKNNRFDININNGKTQFLDKNISFEDLKIGIKNDIVNVKTKVLYKENISMIINNNTNLLTNKSYGTSKINYILFDKFFELKDKTIKYTFNKYENTKFKLIIPSIGYTYNYDGNSAHNMKLYNLNHILQYIKFIDINKSNQIANLELKTINNFKNIFLNIDNVEFNILPKKYKKSNNKSFIYPNISINLTNSILAYDSRYVHIRTSIINMHKNIIRATVQDQDNISSFKVELIGKNINIEAKKLSSDFVNKILKKSKIKNGYISLVAVGDADQFNGEVKFHKIILKNVRAVNNLLTFINTTPAAFNIFLALPTLFKLQEVDFDLNGYYIEDGKMNFIYDINKKVLKINSLYTNGKMADFKGDISANFKTSKITAKLQVIFLTDYSKIIKNIPLLGYIVMGEDGNFATNVSLDGTFEKQTFETHILNDTTNGIFNIIKRTIMLPVLPFIKNNKEKKKEH